MTTISLRPVTAHNVHDILKLSVAPSQEKFVAPNSYSLAEALFEPKAWYRAVYADDTPVGFMMVEEDVEQGKYYLWRFLIDAQHQGKGYGYQAMQLLIERVRRRPNAKEMTLSYVPDEHSPQGFYQKLGFVDTGEMDDDELQMRLIFEGQPTPAQELAGSTVTHTMLFKLKDASVEGRAAALQQLRSLQGSIPSLLKLHIGTNFVNAAANYDIVLIATLDDRAGLEAYQAHETAQAVFAYMQTHCSHIAVVDSEQ
ncbi:MAG: GNAT family N-acetyltransferase [Anaerolineales bacterium]|nr:GNAT family N-acetyltransferase [Anaerolineales bacterium]